MAGVQQRDHSKVKCMLNTSVGSHTSLLLNFYSQMPEDGKHDLHACIYIYK